MIIANAHTQQLLLLLLETSVLALNLTHGFCYGLLPYLGHLLPFNPLNFCLEFVPLPLLLSSCLLFCNFVNLLLLSLELDYSFLKMSFSFRIDPFGLGKFLLMHFFDKLNSVVVFNLFMGEL